MFNSAWNEENKTSNTAIWENSFCFIPEPSVYKLLLTDIYKRKYTFSSIDSNSENNRIGINANLKNSGFRNDGSLYYGSEIEKLIHKDSTSEDYNYKNTFQRIENGNKRFNYGNIIRQKSVVELAMFLHFCHANKINVIAFLPPFADQVYQKMQKSGHYGYLNDIYPKLKPIFKKYQFELYDYSSVSLCHSDDGETLDGFHGSEVTYQKLLIDFPL